MWKLCCSDHPLVAIAAPRGHAKSTAVTHAYGLTNLLFRASDFALVVSDTETQAAQFLVDMKAELTDNHDLMEKFRIRKLIRDTETDFICQMHDGHKFRVIGKGSEQKVRGLKWKNKRPNLILADDLENDEIVMNPERREKFRRWFMNALLPAGSDDCKYRVVGTILHLDAMLMRLMGNKQWLTKLYRACNGDFSEILWPEKFPKERLLEIRANYEAEYNLEGWAQEYLNNPVAIGETYFRKDDFQPMTETDKRLRYVAAADFAISEKEKADFTVIMVAGVDDMGNIYIVDVRRGRWDSLSIIDELISVQKRYNPDIFTFETEKIDKALGPFLNARMRKEGVYLNIEKVTPTKSKATRGRSIQAKMKAGAVFFDKEAEWYPALETELMTMTPGGSRGKHDDTFDAFAYIGLTVDKHLYALSDEEQEEEDYWDEFGDYLEQGRSAVTGY